MRYVICRILIASSIALAPIGCTKKGADGHDHGEGGHEEHEEGEGEGHDDHGEGGHDKEGEGGHDDHEEGVVQLSPEALAEVSIKVATATKRKIPRQIRTTARVDYDETRIAHVGPRIPGRVHKVSKRLGDMVEADEELATLDSVVLGESIAQHRAAAVDEELARKTLDRERALLKEKLTSEQQLIEAEATHQKAVAAKRVASEQLRLYGGRGVRGSYYKLRSPIAGKIVQKHLALGELVTPEDKVYTVADLSALWIWVDIFERDLGRVHVDDDATVTTDAYGSDSFVGKVAYVMDEVDPDTRTVRARIDIANVDGRLKPGMFANVTLSDPHGDTTGTNEVVAVPPDAIQRDGDGWIVFVTEGGGKFERREVKVGVRTPEFVEVLSGIEDGDQVVTKGAFLLKSEAAKESMGGGHSH